MAVKHKGSSAQQRRRARRAAVRSQMNSRARTAAAASDLAAVSAVAAEIELVLVAGATSYKGFPLSDRNRAWDSGQASKRWQSACDIGADGADWAKFHTGFMWFDDKNPETVTGHKLQYVDVLSGTATAVWGAITAIAGILQGARGGVQIPSADVPKVKAHVEKYYADAEKKYDDPDIEVPWADSGASIDAETMAHRLAYAEVGGGLQVIRLEDGAFKGVFCPEGSEETLVAYQDRYDLWLDAFASNTSVCDNCNHPAGMHADTNDGDNMGSCSAEGCDCSAFEAKGSHEAETDEMSEGDPVAAVLEAAALLERGEIERGAFVETVRLRLEDFTVLADGATTPALPDEHQPGERVPRRNPSPRQPQTEQQTRPSATAAPGGQLSWNATIVLEGALTDDRRAIVPGALDWRELPLSLGAMLDTPHADVVTNSEVCGRIDQIWRAGDELKASGIFDPGDYGQKIAGMVADGTLRGVSVDLAIHHFDVGPRSEWFDEDGAWREQPAEEPEETEEPSLLDLLFEADDDDPIIYVITSATIGAVTVCPFAAFADAKIAVAASLVAGASPGIWTQTRQFTPEIVEGPLVIVASAEEIAAIRHIELAPGEVLTASAAGLAPELPPYSWFENPELEELTPVTIDDEGRIFGHAAAWDTCHIGIAGVCTTPPHSKTSYSYFHVGELVCEGGERVAVGRITFGTGHADRHLSRAAAAAHYDDSGMIGAFVRAGEDEHGIWIAGALASDISVDDAQRLRGSAPSGDWRNVDGNLEMVALLAVNVPGFPVPRPQAAVVASGEELVLESLTAAGLHAGPRSRTPEDDFREIVALAGDARGDYAAIVAEARGD